MNQNEMKEKKVLIVGMGRSGKAAAEVLHGLGAEVVCQDSSPAEKLGPKFVTWIEKNGIRRYFGCLPEDLSGFDLVVLSPGVPPYLPFIREAEALGAEVIGELELAWRVGQGRYVAITGTNGKTTTTTLVGEIFEASGRKTEVVGNIGVAAVSKAACAEPDEWLITEASSFQLETTRDFHPVVSAILNLTPDHLNRHKTMEAYGAAKAMVFRNQTADDYLVINYDDKACFALAEGCRATVVPFSRREELDYGAYLAHLTYHLPLTTLSLPIILISPVLSSTG